MSDPFFFGYGSLVNRATHGYGDAAPARVHGWRRHWRQIASFPRAILTAAPEAGSRIDGLIARVPGADWAALDAREAAYDRITVTGRIDHSHASASAIAIYEIPAAKHPAPEAPHPIALSYLDVVVQGYLEEFGLRGVADFFATTTGWEAGILDDRSNPLYPRAGATTLDAKLLTDKHLSGL
ncbi:gamma-glutamylcyclotransferase family protein [Pseudoruegeria sp. SHC-113]|uniref:gamma-glutamylcyclotransferase family protein n=1 Tax=Pseudoruegeria sp. SHC-113 TaxID=2855439 RepID=UPI0021BADAB8|nr:gamma-glutamylcyclotransferase family protein [Pseudoruegeria sp. SHC-113]MCT8161082.1 gamma-glutamylcyclotransferase [Pseudoruegeria sp. SHC-113]